jgi:hypothetical protein
MAVRFWFSQLARYKTDKTGLKPFLQNAFKISCLNFRISCFLVKSNKTQNLTGLNENLTHGSWLDFQTNRWRHGPLNFNTRAYVLSCFVINKRLARLPCLKVSTMYKYGGLYRKDTGKICFLGFCAVERFCIRCYVIRTVTELYLVESDMTTENVSLRNTF